MILHSRWSYIVQPEALKAPVWVGLERPYTPKAECATSASVPAFINRLYMRAEAWCLLWHGLAAPPSPTLRAISSLRANSGLIRC